MSEELINAEMALFINQANEVDVIITTALIPGRPAPKLITEEMIRAMKSGSVVMDLAAEAGGNCELTEPGTVVNKHGVHIAGFLDLPSRLAPTASQLYGMNIVHFLSDLGGAEKWDINLKDEVLRGALVTHEGELTWPPPPIEHPKEVVKTGADAPALKAGPTEEEIRAKKARTSALVLAALFCVLGFLGAVAPAAFVAHLTVFVLACFVGWQVVWNVTAALHTPLMSVTNAISGIIIVGGMLQISGPIESPVTVLGALAILLATINISGGFLVTQRMLKMFSK
jgi:NAD(P) transhydrogenase subunit alpha